MRTFYTNKERMKVSRFIDGVGESYCFPLGRWMFDQELYDVLIGELTLDEITEDEANAIIENRNRQLKS